jgi:hypothetical protein
MSAWVPGKRGGNHSRPVWERFWEKAEARIAAVDSDSFTLKAPSARS